MTSLGKRWVLGYRDEWPSQKAVHTRIRNYRGPAILHKCSNDGCKKQARDWSWIHNTDYRDIYNYNPLCRSCHLLYDEPKAKPCVKDCSCNKHTNSGNFTNHTRGW